jgi:hypothetical protein
MKLQNVIESFFSVIPGVRLPEIPCYAELLLPENPFPCQSNSCI